MREALQPTAASSTTISEAQAAEIRAQVRQAINEGFAKVRSKIAEIPKSGITKPSPSVIDLVTLSPSPQQVVELDFSLHPRSWWLVPLPVLGMVGAPQDFLV